MDEKIFITYGHIFDPKKFQKPTNGRRIIMNKPDGGFWASTLDENGSSWKRWCEDEEFRSDFSVYTKFRFKKSSKIYVIDCVNDLDMLVWSYGTWTHERRVIDWEALSSDYDGVYLTEVGNSLCHLSYPNNLNSWDVESVVVLRQDSIEILEKKNGLE